MTFAIAISCPWCHAGNENSTVERVSGQAVTDPNPGDPCLCTECGKWSVWEEGGKLGKPDAELMAKIEASGEARLTKIGWLAQRLLRQAAERRKRRLSQDELLDLRQKAVQDSRQAVHDVLQLVHTHTEALEVYAGVVVDCICAMAVTVGVFTDESSGEDCVATVLDQVATACADLGIDKAVEKRVREYHEAVREKRGAGQ